MSRSRNEVWGGLLLACGVALAFTALLGVSLFKIALTLFFVWLATMRWQKWAWIPAFFLGFGIVRDIFDGVSGSFFFPFVVIVAGLWLLSRGGRLSPKTVVIAALAVAVTFAFAGARDGRRDVEHDDDRGLPTAAPAERDEIPELDGGELIIHSGSGDVDLLPARGDRLLIGDAAWTDEDGELVIGDPDNTEQLRIQVPEGVEVTVVTRSGDVEADIRGYELALESESGDFDLKVGSGYDIDVNTDDGELELSGFSPEANARADGFKLDQGNLSLVAETREGDIDLELVLK